ncbi:MULTISPECIES: hypothetical protein [unclassified Burkholderia]|uniref:hypothetical protein n=1 Tax=unclassified Burkholderia TaxID=2613784 RepID=UPI00142008C3|nr:MULTISPECIES: hypothetical protein [unclassified Burkholderia]NIE56314.1 hypothetical protein [Burkholderia sp. Ap-955]NIF08319.1 hypothetical protein [Burkholderia sp. Ax-1735]NIG00973.1 hypothetical protein [Burkholderia sp. Tr-849]
MNTFELRGGLRLVVARLVFLLAMLTLSGGATCETIFQDDVIDGYRNCTWRDNGNGTSTLTMDVGFKQHKANWAESAPHWWTSRAFLLYAYDKNGKPQNLPTMWGDVYLNGERHTLPLVYPDHWMFRGDRGDWNKKQPFDAHIVFTIQNRFIEDWPAVSLWAANWSYAGNGWVWAEQTGAVYFYPGGTSGSCPKVDPVAPPPPPVTIKVAVPDWNLGELPRGDGTKTLSNSADQLCFTYSGPAIIGKRFVINATNANGRTGNRYRLTNFDDTSQVVPYNVKLDSMQGAVNLPNVGEGSLLLNGSGKTCFTPTFMTTVGQGTKEGTYGDVLTFTIKTKS